MHNKCRGDDHTAHSMQPSLTCTAASIQEINLWLTTPCCAANGKVDAEAIKANNVNAKDLNQISQQYKINVNHIRL